METQNKRKRDENDVITFIFPDGNFAAHQADIDSRFGCFRKGIDTGKTCFVICGVSSTLFELLWNHMVSPTVEYTSKLIAAIDNLHLIDFIAFKNAMKLLEISDIVEYCETLEANGICITMEGGKEANFSEIVAIHQRKRHKFSRAQSIVKDNGRSEAIYYFDPITVPVRK